MTEKVKLTREQDTRLKEMLKDVMYSKGSILVQQAKGWRDGNNICLNALSLDQLAKVLYEPNSYEVEEEYKVGDWKKVQLANKKWVIGKIDTVTFKEKAEEIALNYLDEDRVWRRVWESAKCSFNPTPEEIKNEKERRAWAKIGRGPGEFRDGDFGISEYGNLIDGPSILKARYELGQLQGFFPAESFIKFGGAADA
ncbi:hypothetical protein MKY41_11620 [Sporosarcina sp. FSL W7-1349]|uniref:hypothetical protein n=1 Tax=Sporosarcina sp. FSL W7-1349 TaxID=2921561 RepID=UPI0030F7CBD3